MVENGFSGSLGVTGFYYFMFVILLSPIEILIYSLFYKDYAYDHYYRIFGHYKLIFSYSLVETEYIVIECLCASFDWCIIYLPFELK